MLTGISRLEFGIIAGIALAAMFNVVTWGVLGAGVSGVDLSHRLTAPLEQLQQRGEQVTPQVLARRERAVRAENDDSAELPGRFVPTQGRSHVQLGARVPFCDEPAAEPDRCYSSNPPSSGLHYGVQRNVRLSDGHIVNIPPDPGLYDFPIPRESIPHIQEHAGVYVGFNCESDACADAAATLRSVVRQEIAAGKRVILSPDPDLPVDSFGLASWTRVDTFTAAEFTVERVRRFIHAHSCRFDPEGFCPDPPRT